MMKRAFLRLKSGKGSVLFFIIAIMSIMIILASAVYYSVTSSRKQVELRYEGEQAYQSALSLNDIITNYISTRPSDPIVNTIVSLNENETIVTKSTDGNAFTKIGEGLGEFKVTVRKIKIDDVNNTHVIEITTETDVNGEKKVVTSVGEFQLSTVPYCFDRFFTSTGYAPNDVIFKNMKGEGTIYLDNEYSQFGGSGSGDLTIKNEIISAGSVRFESPTMFQKNNDNDSVELTIGDNAYFFGMNGSFDLKVGRIGGNCVILNINQNLSSSTPLYVMGDCYSANQFGGKIFVDGDMVIASQNPPSGYVYVNGDLFYNSGSRTDNNVHVGGNIYMYADEWQSTQFLNNSSNSVKGNIYNLKTMKVYKKDGTVENLNLGTFDENYLKFSLYTYNYESEDSIREKLDYVQEFCNTDEGGYNDVWPVEETTYESVSIVKATIDEKIGKPEYINWDLESQFVNKTETNGVVTKEYVVQEEDILKLDVPSNTVKVVNITAGRNKLVIDEVKSGGGKSGLLFDTYIGEKGNSEQMANPDYYEDIYVYLEPNCYYDAANKKYTTDVDSSKFNSFCWSLNGAHLDVLVKGMGSLVIVVPDGVRYVQNSNSFVGHIGIYEKGNGATVTIKEVDGVTVYELPRDSTVDGVSFNNNLKNWLTSENLLKDDLINDSTQRSKGYYTHNNVFIVTVDKNASMDFSWSVNTIGSFIYAPYMTFTNEGVYSPNQNGVFGGMIVSDYTLTSSNNSYLCTVPYDYYGRFVPVSSSSEEKAKYMEKLMADSGCTTILGSSTSRAWRKYGYN